MSFELGEISFSGVRGSGSWTLVSKEGLEVNKVKITVIQNLLVPTSIHELCGFLGHIGIYHKFSKDFAKNL